MSISHTGEIQAPLQQRRTKRLGRGATCTTEVQRMSTLSGPPKLRHPPQIRARAQHGWLCAPIKHTCALFTAYTQAAAQAKAATTAPCEPFLFSFSATPM